MRVVSNIFSAFSWRGTIKRLPYLGHSLAAAVLFAAGVCLQLGCEASVWRALGVAEDDKKPLWLAILAPLAIVPALCTNLFILPGALLATGLMMGLGAKDMEVGTLPPAQAFLVWALSYAMMLAAALRSVALTSRRLRDAGSNLRRLLAVLGGFLLVMALLPEEFPFAALFFALAWLMMLGVLVLMLLRPTQREDSEA